MKFMGNIINSLRIHAAESDLLLLRVMFAIGENSESPAILPTANDTRSS